VQWGREHGLTAVNFPAPRADLTPFNDPIYERFWSVCEDLDLVLCTHSGGGELASGFHGPMGFYLNAAECHWLSRRGLHQLMFTGVFERHPTLKLVFAEQRAAWVPQTLTDYDSVYLTPFRNDIRETLPKRPSEYWYSNCYIAGSMLSPFEVEMRHQIGLRNLMWGVDYPHAEGCWRRTPEALRFTFAGTPEDDVRAILGENAIALFGLDAAALRATADRIGPTPAQVDKPLPREELPAHRGLAFREIGIYA
jgi:predicted TIM-barrel fold metal-dependent hydrolase